MMVPRSRKLVASLLLLLALGLQVQTSFACELQDHAGPVEECCCDDFCVPEENDSSCCQYSQELRVKGSDPAQADAPAVVTKVTTLKVAKLKVPLVLATFPTVWFDQPTATARLTAGDVTGPPPTPHLPTYLTTQRLRI